MAQLLKQQPDQRLPVSLELYCGAISPIVAGEVVSLIGRVWPEWSDDVSIMAQGLVNTMHEDPTFQVLVAWHREHIVGQVQLFQRVLQTPKGQIPVLAMSGLCCDPRLVRRGIGATLLERAFEEVDLSHYPICLFQTDDPQYFEAKGAVQIENRFTNRRNRKNPSSNPWRMKSVMIYPNWNEWPGGDIDLNGAPF